MPNEKKKIELFCRNKKSAHRPCIRSYNGEILSSKFKNYYVKKNLRFLIAIDSNSRINRFPKDIRMEICYQINLLLNKIETQEQILISILNDTKNGSYWTSKFDLNDFNELKTKLNSEKYKKPLIVYFKNLIRLIQYLKINPTSLLKQISKEFQFINPDIIRNIAHSIFGYFGISKKPIDYNKYVDLCYERDDLVVGMSEEDFENAMRENNELPKGVRKTSSKVKLYWKCASENHTWPATFNSIKNKNTKCPICFGTYPIDYNKYVDLCYERDDLVVGMSEEDFENAMRENNELPKGVRLSPSYIPLEWECKAIGHTWSATYGRVKSGNGCPFCFYINISISYNDYLELGSNRDDLKCSLSKKDFEDTMRENNVLPKGVRKVPSQVLLEWRCLKNSAHGNWLASYSSILAGSGCFFCGDRIKIIGHLIHPIIEYCSLKLLVDLYKCNVSYETHIVQDRRMRPDLIIQRNDQFRDHLEHLQFIINFPNIIKFISVDFTFGLNIDGILRKCAKQYHNDDRFLLIVMLRENSYSNAEIIQNLILNDDCIDKKENIQVINFSDYLEFLGLLSIKKGIDKFNLSENEMKIKSFKLRIFNSFIKTIDLALESIESDSKLKKLKDICDNCLDSITKYK